MEYITLIGIVIIVVGFAFKLDVLATVIISGIVTGLVSGMNIIEILEILGSSFVSNRLMSIFLIIFPVIAIIERYGLKERAAYLIGKIKNASAGKVLAIYSVIRTIASALNIRIGGVVQFVRPLIMPMAQAAGEKVKGKELTENELPKTENLLDTIKRVLEYWNTDIKPEIEKGKRVIIAAHGNSLRGLIKYLDNISDEDIIKLELQTGNPICYELDNDLKPIRHYYLKEKE